MITGLATKITNFGAVKIVLGVKRCLLYLGFVMAFSLLCGSAINIQNHWKEGILWRSCETA